MAHLMHRAVDGVAGRVDLVGAVHQLVAGLIDLDQARGGDFMEHHPERVDQEILGTGNLCGNMGEDQVIPTMQRDKPITGGKVHPGLPFGRTDLILDAECRLEGRYAHGSDLWFLICLDRNVVRKKISLVSSFRGGSCIGSQLTGRTSQRIRFKRATYRSTQRAMARRRFPA